LTAEPPRLANLRASLNRITTAAEVQDIDSHLFLWTRDIITKYSTSFFGLVDTQTGLSLQELLHLLGRVVKSKSSGITLTRGKAVKKEPLSSSTLQIVELFQQRAKKSKRFYALLSCHNEQQSWEFPELGHGVFTY
jgi:hypothetical protein